MYKINTIKNGWGMSVDSSNRTMGISIGYPHLVYGCIQFVRSLWVKAVACAQLVLTASTQIFMDFQSVISILFPITHSAYYNVYFSIFLKPINNKGCV